MKTHDLAKALRSLANLLENAPDIGVDQISVTSKHGEKLSGSQLAVNLSTLVELSRVDKQQWIGFIKELGFPLEIRPRDASRDILGKLLNYLEENRTAREQLKTKAGARGSQASPELMKALSSLLKDSV